MDAFKNEEILRMEKGGNNKCKEFFEKASGFLEGMTINERYSSDFAADYKEKVGLVYLGAPAAVSGADRQMWLCS
jgi:ADP-ribosylation factor GTPase-activating protein 1